MSRPSTAIEDQLRIEQHLTLEPTPVSVESIVAALRPPLPRRTVQRRLAELVARRRIVRSGAGRGAKYRLPGSGLRVEQEIAPNAPTARAETVIPLSPEARELQAAIRRPFHLRPPVGYQIEFLDRYHPNSSYYLPEALRAQLREMGASPMQDAPAGTFARDILNRLLIDLSWASSHLEGNTYSRLDTQRLIELGEAAAGKDSLETQMILNHKAAIEHLVDHAARLKVDRTHLIALHALLADGLMPDPTAIGRLRKRAVDIGGSAYRPLGFPQQVAELFDIVVASAAQIDDPFEQAFFLMVHLPYLQPFEDVNKRVSRLAANIPLIRRNLCPLSFIDVPPRAYTDAMLAVYEFNRIELLRDVFAWAYERSCQQYVAVQKRMVPPDTFRLRYRAELAEAMRTLVQGRRKPTAAQIARATPRAVPAAARRRFADLVLREFESLHAGNVVRFGLHPFEFDAWQKATRSK
ncbi:MAG: Fic family protein [Betaproteobacteria bacterium]